MQPVFSIHTCTASDLPDVLTLESLVLDNLDRPDQLRRNTVTMWQTCLQPPHYTLGAWVHGHLVALAVLYFPDPDDPDSLAPLLRGVDVEDKRAANYKICMVHPGWRGHGLQVRLGCMLHTEARHQGVTLLCATVSPHNAASIRSLQQLGYTANCVLEKYGFERILFYRID